MTELEDNNKVAVALVLIPLDKNKWEAGNTGVAWVNILVRLRVQCILLGERIRYLRIGIKRDGVLIDLTYLD